MKNIIIIFKDYRNLISDLVKIIILEYFPNRILILLYSLPLIKILRPRGYNQPNFVNKKQLAQIVKHKLNSENFHLRDQITQYNISNYCKYTNSNIWTDSDSNIDRMALLIIPQGWLNSDSNEGRTQGPQIEFLIKGLQESGVRVQTFEVKKNSNDFIFLQSQIKESDLIFIWSLTVNSPEGELFNYLQKIPKKALIQSKIIGVITASPSKRRLNKYKEWAHVLHAVIYYEENSDYRRELEKIIPTFHIPLLQITPIGTTLANKFSPSVHSSCLLKYNRGSWLLTLKYQALALGIKYHIRAMSIPLSNKGFRKLYQSNDTISIERSVYGFGFVMIHRNQNLDAHLIGSFWDYYRLGVIPVIQMQEVRSVASYMHPYLDYFPINSDQDLFIVLSLGKSSPELFDQLRIRILSRMQTEFTPKIIVGRLLLDLNKKFI